MEFAQRRSRQGIVHPGLGTLRAPDPDMMGDKMPTKRLQSADDVASVVDSSFHPVATTSLARRSSLTAASRTCIRSGTSRAASPQTATDHADATMSVRSSSAMPSRVLS